MGTPKRIVLASASPRRRELLSRAGFEFDVVVSDTDETVPKGLNPVQAAQHTAIAKAMAVAMRAPEGSLVIGADTMVVLDGDIFGKPRDAADACRMLAALSGRTHEVITGVCLTTGASLKTFAEATLVTFKELGDEQIRAYVETGEPLDKAGAYGIQGLGGELVDHIEGDYDNVVGLPVTTLTAYLQAYDLAPAK